MRQLAARTCSAINDYCLIGRCHAGLIANYFALTIRSILLCNAVSFGDKLLSIPIIE